MTPVKSLTLAIFASFALAAATVVSLAVKPAAGADLPVTKQRPFAAPPVAFWEGWSLGVFGGGAINTHSATITGGNPLGNAVLAAGAVPGTLKTEPNGWLVGVSFNRDWQVGSFVYGVEATVAYADVNGGDSQTLVLAPLSLVTTSEAKLGSHATFGGRFGFTPWNNTLLYVAGGGAYAFELESNTAITLNAPAPFGASAVANVSPDKFGWYVGGGIDVAVLPNLVWRTDYKRLDFGDATANFGANVGAAAVAFQVHQDMVFHRATTGLVARW